MGAANQPRPPSLRSISGTTDKEVGHGVVLTGTVPGQSGTRAHPLPASSAEGRLKGSAPATELSLRAGAAPYSSELDSASTVRHHGVPGDQL